MTRILMMALAFHSRLVGCRLRRQRRRKDKIYDIKGKVTALMPEENKLRLDHEAIPGFMKAMEMSFDVESAKLLEGLQKGDVVQGKLKVENSNKYTITELKKP